MLLQKRLGGGEQYNVMEWTLPFFLGVGADLLGLPSPSPEERQLSMAETGEKERNYLFKSYTDLE